MKISKEKAAVRQIDTAIRLLFDGGDPVSVHTLAAAAGEVFRNLLKNKNIDSWKSYAGKANPHLNPHEVHRILTKSQNFFKHANEDPEAVLDFEETDNDYMIILALSEYMELINSEKRSKEKRVTVPMTVFQYWFFAKLPDETEVHDHQKKSKRFFPGTRGVATVRATGERRGISARERS